MAIQLIKNQFFHLYSSKYPFKKLVVLTAHSEKSHLDLPDEGYIENWQPLIFTKKKEDKVLTDYPVTNICSRICSPKLRKIIDENLTEHDNEIQGPCVSVRGSRMKTKRVKIHNRKVEENLVIKDFAKYSGATSYISNLEKYKSIVTNKKEGRPDAALEIDSSWYLVEETAMISSPDEYKETAQIGSSAPPGSVRRMDNFKYFPITADKKVKKNYAPFKEAFEKSKGNPIQSSILLISVSMNLFNGVREFNILKEDVDEHKRLINDTFKNSQFNQVFVCMHLQMTLGHEYKYHFHKIYQR